MDFNLIAVVVLTFITLVIVVFLFNRSVQNNSINGSVRPIILNPDVPIEEATGTYTIPHIRDELYLRFINDSRHLYLSIEDDKFILSPNKQNVVLHRYDPHYLLPSYRLAFRHDKNDDATFIQINHLDTIPFVVIKYSDDNEMYLELDPLAKGYSLRNRIHMCGSYGTLRISPDKVGFDLFDSETKSSYPIGIFRLENNKGEFVTI